MDVTAPPRVRLHRVRVGPLQGDKYEYWLKPRLKIYRRYQMPDHHLPRRIISIESDMGPLILPTPPNRWLHQQFPLDTEPWRLPIPPDLQTFREDPISIDAPSEPTPTPVRHHWTDSALGWAAGTVLLAVFVLIVRAAEKCLDRKLFKIRRRQSEEWPTPNVLATSHQHSTGPESGQPSHQEPFSQTIDLPPPYSECAGPKPSTQCEDPPPPYSDCYVSFINPKDGVPSARIMRRGDCGSGSNFGQDGSTSQDTNANIDNGANGVENDGSTLVDVGTNDSQHGTTNAPENNVGSTLVDVGPEDSCNGTTNATKDYVENALVDVGTNSQSGTNTTEMNNGSTLVDVGANNTNDNQNGTGENCIQDNVGANNANDGPKGNSSTDCVININGNETALQV